MWINLHIARHLNSNTQYDVEEQSVGIATAFVG